MKFRCLVFFLLVLGVVESLAQDVSEKDTSKVSSFKAKLAKTELGAKSPDSDKKSDSEDISDLGITVPAEYANETIKKDHHIYYNSTFYSNQDDAKKFWINLDDLPQKHVITHEKLSDSYRQATTVELSFDFPFYGSLLRNITIATGGFLYMGDYLHNWIAATQYVAPLMANFDTSLSPNSVIKYADNGTAFIVQWEKVSIRFRQNDGAFTFQVTLLQNGDVIFAYKDVPYPISNISDDQHPVKVGLSDAYILEKSILYLRRKTVYEYNRIHVTDWGISNNTALYFTALPTCNTFKNCTSCVSSETKLECNWCEAVKRCSDGIDRQRQSWIQNRCNEKKNVVCPTADSTTPSEKGEIDLSTPKKLETSSNEPLTTKSIYNADFTDISPNIYIYINESTSSYIHDEKSENGISINTGALATVLVLLAVVIAVSIWVYYAYKNPESSSGQFLIKYRPSQWAGKKDTSVTTSNSRHF